MIFFENFINNFIHFRGNFSSFFQNVCGFDSTVTQQFRVSHQVKHIGQLSLFKVFYGQEPPSAESTTTECGVNYQLLAVMY